jgi:hypothetical protein
MHAVQKKYQVFVSSTYEDLRPERQEIMHALLELDCIPSGMELFPAANEDQWSLIRGVIDDCDYYVVVIAGRYGSIGPDGVSYTEMEYRYAASKGKPVIAFLHKEPGQLPAKLTEQTEEGRKRLDGFRQFAQKKMCKYWSTAHELGSVVSRSLIVLQRTYPGVGWVRADQVPSAEATAEILRLRERIDELNADLARSETEPPKGSEHLARGDDAIDLACTFSSEGPPDADGDSEVHRWDWTVKSTWNEIFSGLSPLMLSEAGTQTLRKRLSQMVYPKIEKVMSSESDYKGHTNLQYVEVTETSFETVLVQLNALGLITQSKKNRSLRDRGTYWSLTPFGQTMMNRLRAIARPIRSS